jgi:hypothetical protein
MGGMYVYPREVKRTSAQVRTVSEIVGDLRVADEALRRFERLYWLPSDLFFDRYSKGLLDDGEHLQDFSRWAGFYKLRQRRVEAFNRLSREQVARWSTSGQHIRLEPQVEPVPY